MKTLREMMDIVEAAQQPVSEDGIESWAGNPSDRRSSGHESYMTPEYMLAHYKKRLAQIAAGKHKYPQEVAQLRAKIAKLEKQGVSEGSDELYQQAIRKYVQRVANNYLGGGSAHLYGAGNFDSEMFGVDPKQAEQDFDALFPQYLKKLQGGGQVDEASEEAMATIDRLTRD